MLPFRWDENEDWKKQERTKDDDRLQRYDTPQYQNEEDRKKAETNL